MKETLRPISTRLPRSLHQKLKIAAAAQGKTMQQLLREAVERYVSDRKKDVAA